MVLTHRIMYYNLQVMVHYIIFRYIFLLEEYLLKLKHSTTKKKNIFRRLIIIIIVYLSQICSAILLKLKTHTNSITKFLCLVSQIIEDLNIIVLAYT